MLIAHSYGKLEGSVFLGVNMNLRVGKTHRILIHMNIQQYFDHYIQSWCTYSWSHYNLDTSRYTMMDTLYILIYHSVSWCIETNRAVPTWPDNPSLNRWFSQKTPVGLGGFHGIFHLCVSLLVNHWCLIPKITFMVGFSNVSHIDYSLLQRRPGYPSPTSESQLQGLSLVHVSRDGGILCLRPPGAVQRCHRGGRLEQRCGLCPCGLLW